MHWHVVLLSNATHHEHQLHYDYLVVSARFPKNYHNNTLLAPQGWNKNSIKRLAEINRPWYATGTCTRPAGWLTNREHKYIENNLSHTRFKPATCKIQKFYNSHNTESLRSPFISVLRVTNYSVIVSSSYCMLKANWKRTYLWRAMSLTPCGGFLGVALYSWISSFSPGIYGKLFVAACPNCARVTESQKTATVNHNRHSGISKPFTALQVAVISKNVSYTALKLIAIPKHA